MVGFMIFSAQRAFVRCFTTFSTSSLRQGMVNIVKLLVFDNLNKVVAQHLYKYVIMVYFSDNLLIGVHGPDE
eukprot:XP_766158.1 hypothetical protein [Theileria parva strain Muguga]